MDGVTDPIDLIGVGWRNDAPCEVCGDSEFTRVAFLFSRDRALLVCPFCLALAIDKATGWKVWNVMSAWDNTRRVHAAAKAGRLNLYPNADPRGDESTRS